MTCLVLIAGLFLLALGVWGWSICAVSARCAEQERLAFLAYLQKKVIDTSDE